MSRKNRVATLVAVMLLCVASPKKSFGQAFGVEIKANLMPAAGGMGGVGIARPQDLQTAMALNPASLAQRKGTQFSFSGSWVEPTINLTQETPIGPGGSIVQPYSRKSQRAGSIVGNIAVSQDFTAFGLPITTGMGLLTASGLGVDYRDVVESNGTTAELVVLGTAIGAGTQLTDRLSAGFLGIVSTASMDGVFTGATAATPDYNLRASLGLNYDLTESTTIGGYWMTEQRHTFNNFIRIGGTGNEFQDVNLEFPYTYGIGVANNALCCGRLLFAVDVTMLEWSETDLFGAIWKDQWAVQTGTQYTTKGGRLKYRLGYTWAKDASADVIAPTIGGVTPQAGVDYLQALFPNINQHRLSAGIGLKDLLPGVDFDLFAGGMFDSTRDYGDTTVSVAGYWIGFGATWRFGRGGCGVDAPCRW